MPLPDDIRKLTVRETLDAHAESVKDWRAGKLEERDFRFKRLANGTYGQAQQEEYMFRIKIPYGELTADKLRIIADIAQDYTHGISHLTTRLNIQLLLIRELLHWM